MILFQTESGNATEKDRVKIVTRIIDAPRLDSALAAGASGKIEDLRQEAVLHELRAEQIYQDYLTKALTLRAQAKDLQLKALEDGPRQLGVFDEVHGIDYNAT